MREIKTHQFGSGKQSVVVRASNAGVIYDLVVHHGDVNKPVLVSTLAFQQGPVSKRNPPNGITVESLIAVCLDRLEGFQKGKNACPQNKAALEGLAAAMGALHARTAERIAAGVEGTSETISAAQAEKVAAAAEEQEGLDSLIRRAASGKPFTREQVDILAAANHDGKLGLALRRLVTQALVDVDIKRLLVEEKK